MAVKVEVMHRVPSGTKSHSSRGRAGQRACRPGGDSGLREDTSSRSSLISFNIGVLVLIWVHSFPSWRSKRYKMNLDKELWSHNREQFVEPSALSVCTCEAVCVGIVPRRRCEPACPVRSLWPISSSISAGY